MERYYPARLPQIKPPADFAQRAERYTGSYRSYRGAHSTVEKFLGLSGSSKFSVDGNMLMSGGGRWIEVKPDVFRQADGDQMLVFAQDASATLHALPSAFASVRKLRWHEAAGFHQLILGLGAVCFVLAIISALRNRKADRTAPPAACWARALAAGAGCLLLLFLIFLGLTVAGDSSELIYGFPPLLKFALALPLLAIPLTLALVYFAARAWREKYWNGYGRIQYSVIALASVAFLWSLNYWNLVGYKFG